MDELGYYPGCSLKASARNYEDSLKVVMDVLGVRLLELEDWNCCGASSAHQLDGFLSVSLPARNLAIAGSMGAGKVLVPCPACFIRLKEAYIKLSRDRDLREKVLSSLGRKIPDGLDVVHPMSIMGSSGALKRFSERASGSLKGVRVACYYGCYMVRPPEVVCPDDPENPMSMERVVEALGAETVDWSWKVECCGGSQVLVHPERFSGLSVEIGRRASEAGADLIVTLCPLCHSNLSMHQNLPVFYLTELVAAGMGLMKLSGF